jgi:benzoyl-CoA-dihydrodiol lyase
MGRELDDAILMLRTNELDIGTWLLKTTGDADRVLAADATLAKFADDWFVRETTGLLRRALARLDVCSRTLIALIDAARASPARCSSSRFAADRSYMLDLPDDPRAAPRSRCRCSISARIRASTACRASHRAFIASGADRDGARGDRQKLVAHDARELGLVTAALDDIDWADEIRIVLEERASMSPDALTGMEANLRFGAGETMETRVFGRLSAWQNWIFIRPNAVGETGALKVFGTATSRNSTGTACNAQSFTQATNSRGMGMASTTIDYAEKIPNNVNLAEDRTLQRALERWQPEFLAGGATWGRTARPTSTSTCARR